MQIYSYDTRKFPFATMVADHLQTSDLTTIHKSVDYPLFSRENDQGTVFHKKFYTIGDQFYTAYRQLIHEVIKTIIGVDFIYQRVPTFRVHLTNNLSVGEFHRDRDYFHDPAEINFWLPLTRAWDTNTIWIESIEGKEDFRPHNLKYGQVLMFDGSNLKHGNKINRTGFTRVSFDFRIIPSRKYKPSERRTINTKMRFIVGEYFEKL